jgi:hypothetical protein
MEKDVEKPLKKKSRPFVDDLMKNIEEELDAYQHKEGVIPMLQESRQELLSQVREQLNKLLADHDTKKRLYEGFELIYNESFRIPHANHVIEEIRDAGNNLKIQLNRLQEEGDLPLYDTLQEFLNISPETLQGIYSIGLQLMDEKNYKNALAVMGVITSLNHLIFEPWFVSGICAFEQEMFVEALHSFALATLVDPYQPAPHLYSTQIYLQIGHKDLASKTLQWALTLINEKDRETYKKAIRSLHHQLQAA